MPVSTVATPLRLPNGFEVCQLCRENTLITYRDIFEDGIYDEPTSSLENGDANIGLFLLYLNGLGRRLAVYAFEPIPDVFAALEANARKCDRLESRLYHAGASDRTGQATFTFYPKTSTSSSMYPDESPEAHAESNAFIRSEMQKVFFGIVTLMPRWLVDFWAERLRRRYQASAVVQCPVLRVSDVIRQEGVTRIDLLKLDVEGAEFDCVAGIDADHWPMIRRAVIEIHGGAADCDRMEDILTRHGLAVRRRQLFPDLLPRIYLIYAQRP
jgi:FkbM family methyltransferase